MDVVEIVVCEREISFRWKQASEGWKPWFEFCIEARTEDEMICVVSEMINEGFDTGNVIVVLKCFDPRTFSFHSEGVMFDAYTGSCLPYMATNWFKEIVQP